MKNNNKLAVVHGKGTSTSDSIPARYSKGETVLSAAQTQHIGVQNLRNMIKGAPKSGETTVKNGVLHAAGGLLDRLNNALQVNPNSMRPPDEQRRLQNGARDSITGLNPNSMVPPAVQVNGGVRLLQPAQKEPTQPLLSVQKVPGAGVIDRTLSPEVMARPPTFVNNDLAYPNDPPRSTPGTTETLIGKGGLRALNAAGNAIKSVGDYLSNDATATMNQAKADFKNTNYGKVGGALNVISGPFQRQGAMMGSALANLSTAPSNEALKPAPGVTSLPKNPAIKTFTPEQQAQDNPTYLLNAVQSGSALTTDTSGARTMSGDGYSISERPGSGVSRLMQPDQTVSRSGEPLSTINGQLVYMKTGAPVVAEDAPEASRPSRQSTPESRAQLDRTIALNKDPEFKKRLAEQNAIVEARRAQTQAGGVRRLRDSMWSDVAGGNDKQRANALQDINVLTNQEQVAATERQTNAQMENNAQIARANRAFEREKMNQPKFGAIRNPDTNEVTVYPESGPDAQANYVKQQQDQRRRRNAQATLADPNATPEMIALAKKLLTEN